jgi:hypothetical protein
MLQRYTVTVEDRTGRTARSVATGNTARAAVLAAVLNAPIPRADGGLGMTPPVRATDLQLAAG